MTALATVSPHMRLVTAFAMALPGAALACVDSLQPGHWCVVPNSHMESVAPLPPTISQSLYDSIRGTGGAYAVMNAWGGGTFDSKRDRLVIWGGGHTDYGGNEVYAFDVNTLTWALLTLPSAGPYDQPVLSDGRPVSVHSYDGLEYLPPPIDRMFARGAGLYRLANASTKPWFFNFDANNWEQLSDFPESAAVPMGAFDPVSRLVYLLGSNNLYSYNPATDQWTYLQASPGYVGDATMAIDPKRRKMVRIGNGTMHVWDLNNMSVNASALSTSGAKEIIGNDAPGFVYDPVSDRFVAWSGGSAVYSLNMDTLVWTLHSPAAGNSVTPTAVTASGGTYGRFQYIPSKNAFIAVNATDENVYFYKLSSGSGGSPPARPAAPTVTIR